MITLFENIEDIQDYVGGSVDTTMKIESLQPFIETVYADRLEAIVSEGFIETLEAGEESEEKEKLKEKALVLVRKSILFYALAEYATVGNVTFSQAGLLRQSNDHQDSAYKYQAAEYKLSMIKMGGNHKDRLMSLLLENKETLSWTYEKEYFIHTAKRFTELYGQPIGRESYEHLRPLMDDVILFGIRQTIGEVVTDDLLENPSKEENKKLFFYIEKAIASLSVKEGIARNYIQIRNGNITTPERLDSSAFQIERKATTTEAGLVIRNEEIIGNRYLSLAIDYLNKNADDFEGWPIDESEQEVFDYDIDLDADDKIIFF